MSVYRYVLTEHAIISICSYRTCQYIDMSLRNMPVYRYVLTEHVSISICPYWTCRYIGMSLPNMSVYRYVLTEHVTISACPGHSIPFWHACSVLSLPRKGWGMIRIFFHVVPGWNFTLLRVCIGVGSSPPVSVVRLVHSGVLAGDVRYVFMVW
jgi:hypothetical protein